MRVVRASMFVAACMAAFTCYAQASGQWRIGMDQASRITGLQWQSNPYSILAPAVMYDQLTGGNRVEVRRFSGSAPSLPVQLAGRSSAFTVTPSGAVVEVPTRVRIPGRSAEIPATIVEPVAKKTLAKTVVRALPLIGTAMSLADFFEELEAQYQNNQVVVPNPQYNPQGYTSDGKLYSAYASNGGYSVLVREYSLQAFCQSYVAAVAQLNSQYYNYRLRGVVAPNICQLDRSPVYDPTAWIDIVAQASVTSAPQCPSGSYVSGGQCLPAVPQQYIPLTEDEAIQRAEDKVSLSTLVNIVNSLPSYDPRVIDVLAREIAEDPQDHYVKLFNASVGPGQPHTVQVSDPVEVTTTNPDGSTTTKTTTTTATAAGNTVTFMTSTQTVTKDAAGNTTSSTTTTQTPTDATNPNSAQQEDRECGLPDTPPCRIDETGTPSPPDPDEGRAIIDDLIPECLKNGNIKQCFPELPEINWAFQVPTGCSVIPLPGYERLGLTGIDICRFQPIIHDLMSMLWAGAGLFGAVSILGRRKG